MKKAKDPDPYLWPADPDPPADPEPQLWFDNYEYITASDI